ncbi:aminotransferase class I/II-fold pyridoxal phosphate-dependent enzyme [Helicobacter ibis]|uniref:8-amino-7-oxononanoate synthase n=1 Tax=Helicobacter ibis TaxID=2962633 RepID=A0ABT4VGH7_9HELI|nr:aminotransferase class I/II-fold pyridoxal phosphate-dependent enzyme [Helicobacter ibis]MDA3969273.1 aminotransferase class I/II-fold pyridoxal phosphate-dependent enzyme [Helicobacter ibis]
MQQISKILESLKQESNFRELFVQIHNGKHIYKNNKKLLNLASNNYLCANDFVDEFLDSKLFSDNLHFSSSSSRSLSGSFSVFFEFEEYLSEVFNKESLLFNSGYHANVGIVSALASLDNVLFVVDKSIHASVIDGLKGFKKTNFKRYLHNDMESLEIILQDSSKYEAVFVVSEGLFSMEGDFAKLQELVSLKKKYKNMYLYIDEAHSIGIVGRSGLGLSHYYELLDEIDILILTFGKAISSFGACVLCHGEFRDYFINKARSLIYSTALPPLSVAMSYFVFKKLESMQDRREHLSDISKYLKDSLKQLPYEIMGDYNIISIVLKENKKAVHFQKMLEERGYYLPAIKEPTIPKNKALLRISLCSNFGYEELSLFVRDIIEIDNEYLS